MVSVKRFTSYADERPSLRLVVSVTDQFPCTMKVLL